MKRREAKSKGEKEGYKHLNAEFQRIAIAQGPRGSPDLAGTPGPGPALLGAGEEAGGPS